MSRVEQLQRLARRHHFWHLAQHRHGVPGARNEVIHLDAHLQRIGEHLSRRPEDCGELAQYAQHLTLFLRLRLPIGVPQFHRLGGFDEERPGAGRLIVNDATGARARVAPHRDHVAATADGDAGILDGGLRVEPAKDSLQLPHQPLPGRLDLPARGSERGARRVEQFPVVAYRELESAIDRLVG